ncbi:MAG: formate C-acetyltransferase/glycerol dehydratase family glycyl radical enzyme [Geobacteraceae bacterium]
MCAKRIDVANLPGATAKVEAIKERFIKITPEICAERAKLITESYKETEGRPMSIRRAKALEKILMGMSVCIEDDELIVGNQCSMPRSAPVYPEFSCEWLEAELDRLAKRTADVFLISEEVKKTLREDVFPYWKGKTNQEIATALMKPEALEAQDAVVYTVGNYYFNGVGHISANYGKVMREGLNGVIAEAEKAKEKFDFADAHQMKSLHFLESTIIANKAVIAFANRYADEAERLAATEQNAARKAELLEIARICRKVPAEPAETFPEAVQAFWFIHLVIQLESNGHSISPMRFDQYCFPFYEASKASVPAEKAQELLDLMWIKLNALNKVRDENSTMAFAGYPMFMNIIAGGQDREGKDATNELSLMLLQAAANTKLYAPSLSVRVHEGTPDVLYMKAAEVSRMGLGVPAYFNDRIIIPALLSRGLTLEDARDYGIIGCVEPQVGGKTEGWHDAAFFNMAKVIELVLNNGYDPRTAKQIGPKTGIVSEMKTFDDVMAAYTKQMEYFVGLMCHADNMVDLAHGQNVPLPFLSSLVEDCIGRGKSLQEGGAIYNFSGPQGVGVANAGDALTAIKKLCFDENAISLPDLKEIIDKDFEGAEEIRQMLINRAPKYGNDDDFADEIAVESANIYCREVNKYRNPRGGQFQPGLYPASANVPFGGVCGATPDGRKKGTPLADGVSPIGGFDISGPTATVNSVAKLDHQVTSNGTLLNQKFHPNAVKGEEGLRNLIAITETYFKNGGLHVQYNVIDRNTLLEAQKTPDDYNSLVVRVAGYSAFFTALDKSLQDDIISRTEQVF